MKNGAGAGDQSSLWRHGDFLKLWSAQTVSQFGSHMTFLALPLLAVLTLNATPGEMGLLQAAEFAPFLLFGLLAGVWMDRVRRRPVMVAADVGRGVLLASVPAAAALGWLSMPYLYAVAFLVGVQTLLFEVGYQAYLPSLISRRRLVEGNSRLELSRSTATLAGPGLAGSLVQVVGAAVVLLADAASYLISGLLLGAIRHGEPEPARPREGRGMWVEVREGLGVVFGNSLLRAIAATTGTMNLFFRASQAVLIIFLTRELGLQPVTVGLVLTLGSAGGVLGAVTAGRAAARLGPGPVITGAALVAGAGAALIPLAGSVPAGAVLPVLAAGHLLSFFAVPVYNINQVSLRQTITPDRLHGRMTATIRFVVWGVMPLGSLLGGALGEAIGVRDTLLVCAAGALLAATILIASPVRVLREQPAEAEA